MLLGVGPHFLFCQFCHKKELCGNSDSAGKFNKIDSFLLKEGQFAPDTTGYFTLLGLCSLVMKPFSTSQVSDCVLKVSNIAKIYFKLLLIE